MKYIITFLFIITLYVGNAKTYQDYYPNGQRHYLFYKKHNNLHGKYTYWHANGSKAVEGMFEKGKREGLWQAWYENGNLCYKRNFVNGEENGNTKYYYENGQLQASGPYKQNHREGHWNIWNEDGSHRAEGNCKLNTFHGKWLFYNNDSVKELLFNCGVLYYETPNVYRIPQTVKFEDFIIANTQSFVFVNLNIAGRNRLIIRMNYSSDLMVEKDYNKSNQLHGMYNYHQQAIIQSGEDLINLSTCCNIKIARQTTEYINDIKKGLSIQSVSVFERDSTNHLLTQFEFNHPVQYDLGLEPTSYNCLLLDNSKYEDTLDLVQFFEEISFPVFKYFVLDYSLKKESLVRVLRVSEASFKLDFINRTGNLSSSYSFSYNPVFEGFIKSLPDSISNISGIFTFSPTVLDSKVLPPNSVLHGKSYIYNEDGSLKEFFFFDYGFIREYKKL